MQIIGFYSKDTPYEDEAKIFSSECDKYSLSYTLYPVENKKDWVKNCALKSEILSLALEDHADNLLYLDVDARIRQQPPFEEIEDNLPGYCVLDWPQRHLCSGTIYFPNNKTSRDVVASWKYRQERDPEAWDQRTLQEVYLMYPNKLLDLKWLVIDKNRETSSYTPVIYHTQASRRLKNRV